MPHEITSGIRYTTHIEEEPNLDKVFGIPNNVYEPIERIVNDRVEAEPEDDLAKIAYGIMKDLEVITDREVELMAAGFLLRRTFDDRQFTKREEECLDRQYRSKYILTPGELVVTESAREVCLRHGRIWADYLDRYLAGDLGDWDDEYALLANEQAIFMECPVNAYYHLGYTDWLHIHTDAERTMTRIMRDGEDRLPNRIDDDFGVPF